MCEMRVCTHKEASLCGLCVADPMPHWLLPAWQRAQGSKRILTYRVEKDHKPPLWVLERNVSIQTPGFLRLVVSQLLNPSTSVGFTARRQSGAAMRPACFHHLSSVISSRTYTVSLCDSDLHLEALLGVHVTLSCLGSNTTTTLVIWDGGLGILL